MSLSAHSHVLHGRRAVHAYTLHLLVDCGNSDDLSGLFILENTSSQFMKERLL